MRQILLVYKQVEWVNQQIEKNDQYYPDIVIISYDEKQGVQAIEGTVDDSRTISGKYKTIQRDSEYIRHDTVSLLVGIDLHDGHVTSVVIDTHKSTDFINFLNVLDQQYDQDLKLRIIFDNHSSHISKETMNYLKTRPLPIWIRIHCQTWILAQLGRRLFQQIDMDIPAENQS